MLNTIWAPRHFSNKEQHIYTLAHIRKNKKEKEEWEKKRILNRIFIFFSDSIFIRRVHFPIITVWTPWTEREKPEGFFFSFFFSLLIYVVLLTYLQLCLRCCLSICNFPYKNHEMLYVNYFRVLYLVVVIVLVLFFHSFRCRRYTLFFPHRKLRKRFKHNHIK